MLKYKKQNILPKHILTTQSPNSLPKFKGGAFFEDMSPDFCSVFFFLSSFFYTWQTKRQSVLNLIVLLTVLWEEALEWQEKNS